MGIFKCIPHEMKNNLRSISFFQNWDKYNGLSIENLLIKIISFFQLFILTVLLFYKKKTNH